MQSTRFLVGSPRDPSAFGGFIAPFCARLEGCFRGIPVSSSANSVAQKVVSIICIEYAFKVALVWLSP